MSASALIQPTVYALAAIACGLAGVRARREERPGAAHSWGTLAVLVLGLAVTKLPLVPDNWGMAARDWAAERGWYAERRSYQAIALILVALIGGAGTAIAARWALRSGHPLLPVVGLAILIGHTLVRASSFHHTDALLSRAIGGVRLATMIQVVGLALLVVPALRAALPAKRS